MATRRHGPPQRQWQGYADRGATTMQGACQFQRSLRAHSEHKRGVPLRGAAHHRCPTTKTFGDSQRSTHRSSIFLDKIFRLIITTPKDITLNQPKPTGAYIGTTYSPTKTPAPINPRGSVNAMDMSESEYKAARAAILKPR